MEHDTSMAQEDQTQKRSNSSGGGGNGISFGRSSKRPKQKKVPQRGLGVAQLEKIRLQEQHKKDAVVAAALATPLSPPCSVSVSVSSTDKSSSYPPLPIPDFHLSSNHQMQSSSPIPLPCWSPQHTYAKVSSTVLLANGGCWPAVSVPWHGNVPKLWSSHEFNIENESNPELVVLSNFPYESNPIWPLHNWMQRTPECDQPSSSVVNVSSGSSSTPVPHFSMEPPSNQNYSGSGEPMRPAEKMVGMKRPYPFSLDVPPVPTFNYNLPTFAAMRTNATTSCGGGSGLNFDTGNSTFREVPSRSASNSQPNSKKSNKETKNFNGDFLTLAPPSCPPSKLKSSTFLAFHNQEYPVFESWQGVTEDQIPPPAGYIGFNFNQQKQPLYSFFPSEAKEAQIGQATARIQNRNEVGESVDLNLKL